MSGEAIFITVEFKEDMDCFDYDPLPETFVMLAYKQNVTEDHSSADQENYGSTPYVSVLERRSSQISSKKNMTPIPDDEIVQTAAKSLKVSHEQFLSQMDDDTINQLNSTGNSLHMLDDQVALSLKSPINAGAALKSTATLGSQNGSETDKEKTLLYKSQHFLRNPNHFVNGTTTSAWDSKFPEDSRSERESEDNEEAPNLVTPNLPAIETDNNPVLEAIDVTKQSSDQLAEEKENLIDDVNQTPTFTTAHMNLKNSTKSSSDSSDSLTTVSFDKVEKESHHLFDSQTEDAVAIASCCHNSGSAATSNEHGKQCVCLCSCF